MSKSVTTLSKVWVILLIALTVRVAFALWIGETVTELPFGGTHDEVSYNALAVRLLSGHGLTFGEGWYPWIQPDTPTSYFSGAMALHLAAVYKIFGYHPVVARLLYAVLGTISVYYVYRLGKRLFGEEAGLTSALVSSLYAYIVLFNASLITETPFIFFLLIALDRAYIIVEDDVESNIIWQYVQLGLALALLTVLRSAVLPFVVTLLAWMLFIGRKRPTVKLRYMLIPLAITAALILPWTVRNYIHFGQFMLLDSKSGHVIWSSNHPQQGTTFRGSWVAEIPADVLALENEVDMNNELLAMGIANIMADPIRFIRLSLSRVVYLFTFWPTESSSFISNAGRVLSFGVMFPFMLVGLYLTRRQWVRLLPLYLFMLMHVGVHIITWVLIRYRIPADTILLLFAGVALVTLKEAVSNLAFASPARISKPMGEN